jgi:hypothetical protein
MSLFSKKKSAKISPAGNPIEEKDLKPGDLIFYEADYHDAKKKKQQWDICHVEVRELLI